jgi:uncharacterized protein YhhL (DUF1145 family)
VVQNAAQRMTPVDVMCRVRLIVHALSVFLDDLVGEKEDDEHKGDHQKRTQYYVFGHDNLLVVKRFAIAL